MAKSKTIDEAIDKLLDNYEDVIIKAARYATDETCKEIYQYSMSCLEEYYESYIPSSYERTDYLWHAILPYAEHPHKVGNNIVSTVGVEYDSTKLDGVYNGSQKYRPVDGDWVLDNYLKGIHPATNGSRDPNTVVYYEITDEVSPWDKMNTYLTNTVPERFKSNLYIYFIKNLK